MTDLPWPRILIESFDDPWQSLLSRCEFDPLATEAEGVVTWPSGAVAWFEQMEILRELPPNQSLFCPDCPESPVCDVHWVAAADRDHPMPLVVCPICGPYELPPEALRRWTIDFSKLLRWLADRLEIGGGVDELVPQRLWRIGKTRWGARPTTVFCGRALLRRDAAEVLAEAERSTSAVVLVPKYAPASPSRHPVVPLTLVGHWNETQVLLDAEYAVAQAQPAVRTKPRRNPAGRTKVEKRLRAELEAHLTAVADHVRTTLQLGREPTPLPCPTRKDLARRCRTSEATVCRCFGENRQLERLWETAQDPLAVLALRQS